ncbi:hypothetical protein BG004_001073, partial [Podila humilis]
MAASRSGSVDPPVLITFMNEYKNILESMPTQLDPETDERFILWSDVQAKFIDVNHLVDKDHDRALFEIDSNGDLYIPLRIPSTDLTFTVMPKIAEKSNLSRLIQDYMEIHGMLQLRTKEDRPYFVCAMANYWYHQSLVLAEIAQLEKNGIEVRDGDKDKQQLMKELQETDLSVSSLDNISTYNALLSEFWRRATIAPELFIILPASLSTWDDVDPSTHRLRLYFLCYMQLHVHLSDHPGYDILRPQEFLKKYGEHALQVLRSIKYGHNYQESDGIPLLDSSRLTQGSNANHYLKDNIVSLVEKAMDYLDKISLKKTVMSLNLTLAEQTDLMTHLEVPLAADVRGNLVRHIDGYQSVRWICQSRHSESIVDKGLVSRLEDFVTSHGGFLDNQMAKLYVVLCSDSELREFLDVMRECKRIYDIYVKLNWKASRPYLESLYTAANEVRISYLEIDGVTTEAHPQGFVKYLHPLFSDADESAIRCVTLKNYPRHGEQRIYVRNHATQSRMSSTSVDWTRIPDVVDRFLTSVNQSRKFRVAAMRRLKKDLNKWGLSDAPYVYMGSGFKNWSRGIDLENEERVETYHEDPPYTAPLDSPGAFRTVTAHFRHAVCGEEYFRMLELLPRLQDLILSTYGYDILMQAERITRLNAAISTPLRITLVERRLDMESRPTGEPDRIIAQLMLGPGANDRRCNEAAATAQEDQTIAIGHRPTFTKSDLENQEYLYWYRTLSDDSVAFLDIFTHQQPSALSSFCMDVSDLTPKGLDTLQKVLS